jgi:hypothetical protein
MSLNKMYMLSLLIVVLKTAQIRVRNIFEIFGYMGEKQPVIQVNRGRKREYKLY